MILAIRFSGFFILFSPFWLEMSEYHCFLGRGRAQAQPTLHHGTTVPGETHPAAEVHLPSLGMRHSLTRHREHLATDGTAKQRLGTTPAYVTCHIPAKAGVHISVGRTTSHPETGHTSV